MSRRRLRPSRRQAAADPQLPELLARGRPRWWGAVIWPSFFTACVMTVVFFAMVDPLELDQISALHLGLGRMAGYSLGFAMFWVATLASSGFTLILHGNGERQ